MYYKEYGFEVSDRNLIFYFFAHIFYPYLCWHNTTSILPFICMGYFQASLVTDVEALMVSSFHRVVILVSRPNRSDATDVFVRR